MKLPQLQIHSTRARIGIESELGQYQIKQSPASVQIKSKDAVVHIETEPAVVMVDLTKTWDALTGGKPIPFWNRIYNQSGKYVIDAIQSTVEEYNRIGNILAEGNPIADLAHESMFRERPKLVIFGPASPNNVEFKPVITNPDIQVEIGGVDIQVQPNRPQIDYQRGYVRTFMEQYPSVKVTAPQIDITL